MALTGDEGEMKKKERKKKWNDLQHNKNGSSEEL